MKFLKEVAKKLATVVERVSIKMVAEVIGETKTTTVISPRRALESIRWGSRGIFHPRAPKNTLALKEDVTQHKVNVMTNRSKMMDALYGEDVSQKVFNRLQHLDGEPNGLNEQIQKIAYDFYWALPGLSLRDKSFVTITALMVTHKEEQCRIHLNGFLNSGGRVGEVLSLLVYIAKTVSAASSQKGLVALLEVLKERGGSELELVTLENNFRKEVDEGKEAKLSEHDLDVAEITSTVARGDLKTIDHAISNYLDRNSNNTKEIEHIMHHLVVYCGFPTAMNGFARLREVLKIRDEVTPRAKL